MENLKKCPKCEGEMTLGTMYSGAGISTWKEGEPSRMKWLLLSFNKNAFNPKKMSVKAYGCKKCGFIELYMNEQ